MTTCPQLYDMPYNRKGHARLCLCRLTGQTCLVDSGEGTHCTRRIWYDARIMSGVGFGAAMGQDVKELRAQVPLPLDLSARCG
jgi:hypothetical protein